MLLDMKKNSVHRKSIHNLRFYFSLLIFSLGLQIPSYAESNEKLPDRLQDVWNSVVRLDVRTMSGSPLSAKRGSGVIIQHDTFKNSIWIVSNYHATYCGLRQFCSITVTYSNNVSQRFLITSDIYKEIIIEKDLVILEISLRGNEFFSIATLSIEDPQSKETLYAIGFPQIPHPKSNNDLFKKLSSHNKNAKHYSIGESLGVIIDSELKEYSIERNKKITLFSPKIFVHSAHLLPGSSGGPLVNLKGEVIAINSGIFSFKKCKADPLRKCRYFAIPIQVLLDRLSQ